MPQYNFLCLACKKEFSKILTISEHEKGKSVCPHCKSRDVIPFPSHHPHRAYTHAIFDQMTPVRPASISQI
jgi:putative FmdB family regulatory protein